RQFEVGLAEVAMREHVGLLAYSPLARGLLSGKYLDPSRNLPGRERFSQRRLSATAAYLALAKKHNLDLSALALAFVRQRAFTSSVLMAASTAAQLEANLGSLQVTLSKDLLKEIDSLQDEYPNPR